jgi:hypothetical protein
MIYCLSCGKQIPADSKFCTFCGAPTPVVDPKQPNLATNPPHKPVDVSRLETTKKTYNEFYKDAGFYGALMVLIGFFLPFYTTTGISLFDAVQLNATDDPAVLIWLVFPVTALIVLLHSFIPGWPRMITTIMIFLAFVALALFGYVMFKDPVKYFGSADMSEIARLVGYGFWLTLVGTILLLFHRRHKRVEIHKTKIIDRTL